VSDQIPATKPSTWTWLLALLLGVISIGVGVVVLFKPGNSLEALAVITGVFVFVDGLVRIIAAVVGHTEDRGFIAVLGVFDVVVGCLLVRHPAGGVTFVALLLGIWLLATGLLRIISAILLPGRTLWLILTGAVLAIAGIVIIAEPNIGYGTLAIITAIGFIGYGVAIVAAEIDRHYVHPDVATAPESR
jgi:uncharacterized membrane protein HdeD (DUF308 family)